MAGFSTVAVIVVGAAVVSADVVVVDVVVSRDVSASIVVEVVVVVAVLGSLHSVSFQIRVSDAVQLALVRLMQREPHHLHASSLVSLVRHDPQR